MREELRQHVERGAKESKEHAPLGPEVRHDWRAGEAGDHDGDVWCTAAAKVRGGVGWWGRLHVIEREVRPESDPGNWSDDCRFCEACHAENVRKNAHCAGDRLRLGIPT